VSFAAWIGSLPLMLWYYHLVTLISLVANLVVVPIAFFVLAGALLSLVTTPVSSWLSVVFNNANWALTKLIRGGEFVRPNQAVISTSTSTPSERFGQRARSEIGRGASSRRSS
jgi:predicted membrane metal-binding protein